MINSFFPRDQQFWLYHSGATIFVVGITLISIFLLGDISGFNISFSLVWALPYTFAVLLFRFWYKKRQWHQLSTPKLIALVFVYGTITALLVVASAMLMTLPFYWTTLTQNKANFNAINFILGNLVGGSLNTQLFICSWIFIYANVTNARRSKATEISNLRLQNSLKEAQLSSLSNQLNPHFLFNALNNIRFMMHENAQQADNMIIALSDILRYSLASSEHTKVSLGQELEIIDRYISIVKSQMEERLHFSKDIAEALHAYLLPPMVLQMLIENAIKHGVDTIAGGGRLHLAADELESTLVFTISNDLPPEDAGRSAHLKAGTTSGMGIGLENITQRLRLLYGNQASLNTCRRPVSDGASQFSQFSQFIVTLTIPKERRL